MIVIYSDLKKITENTAHKLKNDFYCTHYVVDFDDVVTIQDVHNLNKVGIKAYYRVKLYGQPTIFDIEKHLMRAKDLKFDGFAIDCEVYSNKTLWKDERYAQSLGHNINALLKQYFNDIIIYPENLDPGKYEYYNVFIDQLTHPRLTVLIERTYEVWRPLQLLKYILINRKRYDKFCVGFWSDSMKDLKGQPNWLKFITKRFVPMIQLIQAFFTLQCKNVFYYTERANFINDDWQKTLMKLRRF